MAGLAKTTKIVKKVKKHGVKAGQKSLIRPSQKKSVKNGKQLIKQKPAVKVVKKVAPVVEPPKVNEVDEHLTIAEHLAAMDNEVLATHDENDEYVDLSDGDLSDTEEYDDAEYLLDEGTEEEIE